MKIFYHFLFIAFMFEKHLLFSVTAFVYQNDRREHA